MSDYQRGLRITTLLVEAGGITLEAAFSSIRPWYDHSLFLLDLGHIARAETQLRALLAQLHTETQQQTDAIQHKAAMLRQEQLQRPDFAKLDVPSIRNRSWRQRAQSYLLLYTFEPDIAQAERDLSGGIAQLARDRWLYHTRNAPFGTPALAGGRVRRKRRCATRTRTVSAGKNT